VGYPYIERGVNKIGLIRSNNKHYYRNVNSSAIKLRVFFSKENKCQNGGGEED
jgi:hypothetical protein